MSMESGIMTINTERCYMARQRGFTLAEALMAAVVLGIAAAGVLLPFSSGAAARAEGMRRTLGAKLAGDLIEQIITKPFLDPNGSVYDYNPGPDAEDTSFDNIDDYHGYSETEGQVKDAAGAVYTDSNYAKFSRDVSCEYVYVPQESGAGEPVFIRVTVQVRWNNRAYISRLVSK
jgi:prepilin-type N-terminal cleavage/methylation domain-containing protein